MFRASASRISGRFLGISGNKFFSNDSDSFVTDSPGPINTEEK